MFKKIILSVKSKGALRTISLAFRYLFPEKLKNFNTYAPYFKNGTGLEIGGPSKIFKKYNIIPIYPIIKNIDGCNFSGQTVWEGKIKKGDNYLYYKKDKKGHQYICDAVDLSSIQSNSYEFIISSNVIEHIANPIKAIKEWIRVLKLRGPLLIVFPHKDKTFDHKRPVTPLSHMIQDFEKDIKEDDLTHLPEILNMHDFELDPLADQKTFKERSMNNHKNRCLHHHVFTLKSALSIVDHCGLQIIAANIAMPHHIIILANKLPGNEKPDNSMFTNPGAGLIKNSPFASDHE